MNSLKNAKVRLGLLLLILMFVGVSIRAQYVRSQNGQVAPARYIPLAGVAENDTGGKVPGDPNNGIEDLKQIYTAINAYRSRHNGAYPPKPSTMLKDLHTVQDLQQYGFKDFKQALRVFTNPDSRYSDSPFSRKYPDTDIVYRVYDKRFDGSPVADSKPSGTRDVLASTNIYSHQNVRTFPHSHSTNNPVGFSLVLWDDGTIQKIPYDRVLYVPKGNGDFFTAFPNQAGVPSNALTYDEFYRLAGWKKGPRGSEGGEGQSYRDKAPR